MYNVIYIGNTPHVALQLSEIKELNILYMVCQKKKICDEEKKFYEQQKIKIKEIETKEDLSAFLLSCCDKVDFAIMYSFGIIIPQSVIELLTIYNLHPGSLNNNRGSSPINWAILLDFRETSITLHRITADIDAGNIISEHKVTVYSHDVPSTLRRRLEGEIPSMILYLVWMIEKNKQIAIPAPIDGTYRPRIKEEDYTIRLDDTESDVKAKIRSQYDYVGAPIIINGVKHYIRNYSEYERIIHTDKSNNK